MEEHERAHVHVVLERGLPPYVVVHVISVPLVIELLLGSPYGVELPIPWTWCGPLTEDVGDHPLIVGPTEHSQVVGFESGAAPVLRCLPEPIPCFLCHSGVETVAVQISAQRIVGGGKKSIGRFGAPSPLIVARAGELSSLDGRGVATDMGKRGLNVERVLAARPVMIEIKAECL